VDEHASLREDRIRMMTVAQFQEEKARLVALYGQGSRAASRKRAQAFARLYAASGWTQQLAAHEEISQARIHQLFRFEHTVITAPIVFTAMGMLLLVAIPGSRELTVQRGTFLALVELGLVMLLFADAAHTTCTLCGAEKGSRCDC
jgi:hypothetical protein